MDLCDARRDQVLQVIEVDAEVRDLLLRMGIGEGSRLHCLERLPGGPLVLGKGFWEVALGLELCRLVHVVPVGGR